MIKLTQEQIKIFQKRIWDFFEKNERVFSWRKTTNPYNIFISEVMLQQTQATRVEKKYKQFIETFPDFYSLANAELYDVLKVWQGLGYNRRAKFLHQSAKIITLQYNGNVPNDTKKLEKLPGIGSATAASIAAFAFNAPTVFVETNIRTVFIHLFLSEKDNICDKELLSLASQTVDKTSPRKWYYALTDYGVMLKSKGINPINKSKSYTKQSKFQGSDRQIRGAIIKEVLLCKNIDKKTLCRKIEKKLKTVSPSSATPEKITKILNTLIKEGLVN